jgi:hypothetical protein
MERTKQSQTLRTSTALPPPPRGVSTAGYWIAAAIALVTVVAGVMWAVVSFVDLRHDIDHFARTDVPGQVGLQLAGSTGQVLYYEGPGAPTLSMLDVSVTDPHGGSVTIREYGGDVEYDAPGGAVGRAVGTFDTSESGSYTVETGASLPTNAVLAVGSSIVRGSGGKVAAGAVGAIAGLVIAGAIALVTAVRRSGARGTVRPTNAR